MSTPERKCIAFHELMGTVEVPSRAFTGVLAALKDGEHEYAIVGADVAALRRAWARLTKAELNTTQVYRVAMFHRSQVSASRSTEEIHQDGANRMPGDDPAPSTGIES